MARCNNQEASCMLSTRRDFLKTTAKMTAGAIAFSTMGSLLHSADAGAEGIPAAEHPFPYVKLDPETTLKLGYEGYFSYGGCGMGSFSAIINQLSEKVGAPFNQVPVLMYANASAGYGVGSLCGSLAGAAGAIALVVPKADAGKITGELLSWYRAHPFPEYQPEMESVTTVANSVNCLESVSKFMEATGLTMADDGRKARCASVTGECAAKAVELLNAHFNL